MAWLFGIKFSRPNLTVTQFWIVFQSDVEKMYTAKTCCLSAIISAFTYFIFIHSFVWGTAIVIQSSMHNLHPCMLFRWRYQLNAPDMGPINPFVVSCPLCHLLHVSLDVCLYNWFPTVTLFTENEICIVSCGISHVIIVVSCVLTYIIVFQMAIKNWTGELKPSHSLAARSET